MNTRLKYDKALRTILPEGLIERVADALARQMFAPHELPLDAELHRKYLTLARAAIQAMREPVHDGDYEEGPGTATVNPMMETLCKLYLELANVVPKECISSRELAKINALEFIERELSAILNTWTFEGDEGQALAVIRDKARAALNS